MKTIKLPYTSNIPEDILYNLMRIQSNITHIAYNRYREGMNERNISSYLKNMNNIKIDSYLELSGIKRAKQSYDRDIILNYVSCFGGKELFKKLSQKEISKEEYKKKRLLPIYSVGNSYKKGNQKFKLDFDDRKITFNYLRKEIYTINIDWNYKKDYLYELQTISDLAKQKKIALTFQLDFQYVYITFDETKIYTPKNYMGKGNRILGIDMNPNYIGYNISEFCGNEQKIIDTGIYDIKGLTKFFYKKSKIHQQSNKRKYELTIIAKDIVKKAYQNNCSKITIEELNIKNGNRGKGKCINRLCNNEWGYNVFIQSLKKQCYLHNIELVEVNPAYSSFIGNLVYSKYPDMVAASCEIARRGYFKYIKGKFYPDLITNENISNRWKDAKYWMYSNWIELYDIVKKSGVKYRIPLNYLESYSLYSVKSKIKILKNFIG